MSDSLKTCSRCKIPKDRSNFRKQSCKRDGLRPECRSCYDNNVVAEPSSIPIKRICKSCLEEKDIGDFWKRRDRENQWFFKCKKCAYQANKPYDLKAKKKRSQLPYYKMHNSVSRGVFSMLGEKKSRSKWCDLLGFSVVDLMNHLQSQFETWMTWENYGNNKGKWVIDHILPIELFELESKFDPRLKVCWSLRNLRPISCEENSSKLDRLPDGRLARNLSKKEKDEFLSSLGLL